MDNANDTPTSARIAHLALLPAVLASCALLGACGSAPTLEQERQRVVAEQEVNESLSAARLSDGEITRTVREQLSRELPLAQIDVVTEGGKVALRGTVGDGELARRAVKGALSVEGVRGVVNELQVAPEGTGGGPALRAATL